MSNEKIKSCSLGQIDSYMNLKNKGIELEIIDLEWEDINPKIIETILNLIDERKISGKTYIGISKSIGEMPLLYKKDDVINGIIYTVHDLSAAKDILEDYRKNYSPMYNIQCDNAITVTVENSQNYVISTILVNAKDNYFMIRFGYPKTKEDELDYNNLMKKFKRS